MKSSNTIAVIGSQWGDEGKGKIIDYLAREADMVVRAQGGSNAGHTVVIGGKTYALHLIPSGVLNDRAVNVIANGVAFDPALFFDELDSLARDGARTDAIYISDRAHIVMPWHISYDRYSEIERGDKRIGTTIRGIGPCYADKINRIGLRICDMQDIRSFPEKVAVLCDMKTKQVERLYGDLPGYDGPGFEKEDVVARYEGYAKRLSPMIADTSVMVHEAVLSGKTVLFEGAQGSMLDIDMGTYPFVTSSHPVSGGFTTGSGIGPGLIAEVIGVTKAYTTRVGAGPFVTELTDDTGDRIREKGHEYGTTTGRARRCGWFDSVVVRHSARMSGTTGMSLMLLDVFDDFDEIKLCTAYEIDGNIVENFPARLDVLERARPVYESLPGWKSSIAEVKTYDELPTAAKAYIGAVERLCGVPVKIVSVGPGREQTIIKEEIFG